MSDDSDDDFFDRSRKKSKRNAKRQVPTFEDAVMTLHSSPAPPHSNPVPKKEKPQSGGESSQDQPQALIDVDGDPMFVISEGPYPSASTKQPAAYSMAQGSSSSQQINAASGASYIPYNVQQRDQARQQNMTAAQEFKRRQDVAYEKEKIMSEIQAKMRPRRHHVNVDPAEPPPEQEERVISCSCRRRDTDDTFNFELKTKERLDNIFHALSQTTSYPYNSIRLFHNNDELRPMDTVEKLGLSNLSVLELDVEIDISLGDASIRPVPVAATIRVKMQNKGGRPVTYNVLRTTVISALLAKYATDTSVNAESLRAQYDGDRVDGSQALEELDVDSDDDEITLDVYA